METQPEPNHELVVFFMKVLQSDCSRWMKCFGDTSHGRKKKNEVINSRDSSKQPYSRGNACREKLEATANANFTVPQVTNHQNETREILHFGRDQNPESRTGNRPGAQEDPAGISSVPPLQG